MSERDCPWRVVGRSVGRRSDTELLLDSVLGWVSLTPRCPWTCRLSCWGHSAHCPTGDGCCRTSRCRSSRSVRAPRRTAGYCRPAVSPSIPCPVVCSSYRPQWRTTEHASVQSDTRLIYVVRMSSYPFHLGTI
ncbi:hypothetical protein NP493_660g02008 [Ridgeia piscesae]|uniref:Uncharacterized protein n=1 Tax=Ridgeia piscesae TaxID=27915 RepID=A0AAD9NR81_RIDPI|nr:hypothetical protein NP493_660g02008 [Ridgeia piscesae]